jgi:hypothetical protein
MQDPSVTLYLDAKYKHAIQVKKVQGMMREVVSHLVTMKRDLQKTKREIERAVNSRGFMSDIIARRFANEGEEGKKWKSLDEKTLKAKRGKPMLVQTGNLKKSAMRQVRDTYRLDHNFNWPALYVKVTVYARYVAEDRAFLDNPTANELRPADTFARKMFVEMTKRKLRK